MSYESYRSRSTSILDTIPWIWVTIIVGVIFLIMIARYMMDGSRVDTERAHLMISPQSSASTVFVSMTTESKSRITGTGSQPLYVGDKSISVETGGASLKNSNISIDLDERSELSYVSHTATGDIYQLIRGRAWIEQGTSTSTILLKNLTLKTHTDTIVMIEQSTQIYSTVYAIQGDIDITTSSGPYTLKSGYRMMVSSSDLSNPGLKLSSLVETIDENITTSALFLRHDGKKILTQLSGKSGSGETGSGSITVSTGSLESSLISIIEPLDGSIATKSTIVIRGSITPDVSRVTLNDIDTIVSLVNSTFTFAEFPLSGEVNNIVYKAYNKSGTQIARGVFTIFGSKQSLQSVNKLIPTTSPISSKEFKITSPLSNPYVIQDDATTVRGTVPPNRVSYITVNNYRLQKYIPGSTNWYYYANTASQTLQNGINSYTISFYGSDGQILYTQLFSIIKESKNATLSGESSR